VAIPTNVTNHKSLLSFRIFNCFVVLKNSIPLTRHQTKHATPKHDRPPGAATAEPHFLNDFQSRFEACCMQNSTEYWFCVHSFAASLAVTAIKKCMMPTCHKKRFKTLASARDHIDRMHFQPTCCDERGCIGNVVLCCGVVRCCVGTRATCRAAVAARRASRRASRRPIAQRNSWKVAKK